MSSCIPEERVSALLDFLMDKTFWHIPRLTPLPGRVLFLASPTTWGQAVTSSHTFVLMKCTMSGQEGAMLSHISTLTPWTLSRVPSFLTPDVYSLCYLVWLWTKVPTPLCTLVSPQRDQSSLFSLPIQTHLTPDSYCHAPPSKSKSKQQEFSYMNLADRYALFL